MMVVFFLFYYNLKYSLVVKIVGILFVIFTLLIIEIHRRKIKYVVTSERVIKITKLFRKNVTSIPLRSIEKITTIQTTLERILKIGTIEIDTGEEMVIFEHVPKPFEVEQIIRNAYEFNTRKHSM
jgi:membrane protein YdbS with pleckstrin-like domain